MAIRSWAADAKAGRAWDGVVFFWVVLWLVIGGAVAYEMWQLTGLSQSAVDSGRALGTAGQALQDLSGLPLIGTRTGQLGDQVAGTGGSIVDSGTRAGGSIRVLALLTGIVIALAPTGPVLLLYLPARAGRRRENRALKAALRDPARANQAMAHLARRAVGNLEFARLAEVSADPEGDLAAGRHEHLARAEMHRLGLPQTLLGAR
ncbi:MAG: hypothetical protein M3Y71_06415 [Actinomycetota bacterium]|nr:hypothetical protein [Actinomycetota bacterium]